MKLLTSKININTPSLKGDLFARFMLALLVVQLILFLLGGVVVSSLIRNKQREALKTSADKTIELYGMLARYGDVRYAKFVVSAGIGSNGFREFHVFDMRGEEIQAVDPTKPEQALPDLLTKARTALAEMRKNGKFEARLIDQTFLGYNVFYRYSVITSDGAEYLVEIEMGSQTFPWLWICLGLIASIVLSCLSAFYIAKARIGSPILSVENYANQVRTVAASSDMNFTVPYSELVPVHNAITEMVFNIKEQAKQVLIAKMVQMTTHDLRAPLGTFERLLSTPDEALPGMRGAVKDALNRLNSMIESLRHSEVENIVHRSQSKFSFTYGEETLRAKAQEHSVRLAVPEADLDDVWLDSMKVERAWINLASNAIEAAQSYVKVETERQGTNLFIRVIDDGQGVPNQIVSKLFQRGMTHGKAGGTGLGLAYVKQIMQGHGGDVTYSRQDGLTIFECRLSQAFAMDQGNKADKLDVSKNSTDRKSKDEKRIAIRLIPESLALGVWRQLSSYHSERFSFSCDYDENTELVVLNDDEILIQTMDDGKEPLQLSKALDQSQIVNRIVRKFNLD